MHLACGVLSFANDGRYCYFPIMDLQVFVADLHYCLQACQ